jgi:hypothetical protein
VIKNEVRELVVEVGEEGHGVAALLGEGGVGLGVVDELKQLLAEGWLELGLLAQ